MNVVENLDDSIKEIKLLISEDDISAALKKLQHVASVNGLESEAIHLLNSFSNLRSKELKGVIDNTEMSLERSKLVDRILGLCEVILNKNYDSSNNTFKIKRKIAIALGVITVLFICAIFIRTYMYKRQILGNISGIKINEMSSIDTFKIRFPVSSNEVRFGGQNPLPKGDLALAQLRRNQPSSNIPNIDVIPNLSSLEYFKLGLTYRQSNMFDKALAFFNKSILEDDKFVNAYIERGVTYRILKEYEKSLEDYSKAISLEDSIAQIYVNRSVVYFLLEMYDLAEEDCRIASKLDHSLPELYLSAGNIYLGKKMYDEAILEFKKALSLKSLYANAIYGLSFAYYSTGDKENYCEMMEKYKNLEDSIFSTSYSRTLCQGLKGI